MDFLNPLICCIDYGGVVLSDTEFFMQCFVHLLWKKGEFFTTYGGNTHQYYTKTKWEPLKVVALMYFFVKVK